MKLIYWVAITYGTKDHVDLSGCRGKWQDNTCRLSISVRGRADREAEDLGLGLLDNGLKIGA